MEACAVWEVLFTTTPTCVHPLGHLRVTVWGAPYTVSTERCDMYKAGHVFNLDFLFWDTLSPEHEDVHCGVVYLGKASNSG